MKKIDTRLLTVTNTTDFDKLFHEQGEEGFKFHTAIPSQFGMKFVFSRESDEDVIIGVQKESPVLLNG